MICLILDNTQTVINVFDDHLGAFKLQAGQTQIAQDKSNIGVWAGHLLTADGTWLSPDQVIAQDPARPLIDQIKALPADKQAEVMAALTVTAQPANAKLAP